MPGCGCAAPSSRPINIPQQRGFLSGSASGPQMSSSYSSPPPAPVQDAAAFNAPQPEAEAGGTSFAADKALQSMSERPSQKFKPSYKSPLKTFDMFATKILKQKSDDEEDYPKLTMPPFRGLHRCKVSALNYHQVDLAVELEQELRNIGIQGTLMMDNLEKLLKAEAACQFQGAVRAAELAAMAAPNGLAEEAAVAASRGYSVDAQQFARMASGENPIEIVGYIGCTRPDNF